MQKEEWLDKVVNELRLKRKSQRTIQSYTYFIKNFLEKISDPEIITEDELKSYLVTLIDRYNSKSQALLNSSLRFLYTKIIKKPGLLEALETPKIEKKLPIVLTKEEVQSLIDAAEFEKTKIMIAMLYATGLRVSELVNLTPNNINFEEGTGWVRKGKGSKDRLFKIGFEIIPFLKNYLKKNQDNKYLLSKDKPLTIRNIQLIIKRVASRAGINKKISPHTLRHTFATHLLEQGENLVAIQELLGHESLETTRIYVKVSQEQIKKVKSPMDSLKIRI